MEPSSPRGPVPPASGSSPAAGALPAVAVRAPADPAARLRWWQDAKFGMLIHFGLYSLVGRHEWVLELEAMPAAEYDALAERFAPAPGAAARWAALARRAGMRYLVLTAKHHDGFCLFDTALTDYCAPRRACGRDLVRECLEAARAEGLRVGLYYSLMDWHHPDGATADRDEAARRRLVAYAHGQLRELLTQYGTVDVLWYDSPWPLDADGWEAQRMNEMARALQPAILLNDRNGIAGDFATVEQRIPGDADGRAWETCTTTNESWGYQAADEAWKTPKDLVSQLLGCARGGGNYLLNIGPRGDGTVPRAAEGALHAVGDWLARNAESVYGTEPCAVRRSACASFTRKGRTLYMHVRHWPGREILVGGLQCRVTWARLLASDRRVEVEQDGPRLRLRDLPASAPDWPVTTVALGCAAEPRQDTEAVRRARGRGGRVPGRAGPGVAADCNDKVR